MREGAPKTTCSPIKGMEHPEFTIIIANTH